MRPSIVSPLSGRTLSQAWVSNGETIGSGTIARVATSGGPVTVLAPTTLYPDASSAAFVVVDADGDAATNPITVDGNGRLIDGQSSYVISVDEVVTLFLYDQDSGQWNRALVPRKSQGAEEPFFLARDVGAGGSGSDSAANVGTGAAVFKQKAGAVFQFRRVSQGLGAGESVTQSADDVILRPVPPDWVNVRDFGATGDGVTDDAPAIELALAAMGSVGSNGGVLYFPKGTYRAASDITLNRRIDLRGPAPQGGYAETILFFDMGKNLVIVYEDAGGHGADGADFQDIQITSSKFVEGVDIKLWSAWANPVPVGARTRIANDNRYYFEAVVGGNKGGAQPVEFGTPADGGDWLDGVEIVDGAVRWVRKVHAINISTRVTFYRVAISGFSNAGLHVQAGLNEQGLGHYSNANQAEFNTVIIGDCGVGVFVRGNDTQRVKFQNCQATNIGSSYPTETGGHGYHNHSFLGASFDNCLAEGCTGRGRLDTGGAAHGNVCVGQHAEACLPSKVNYPTTLIGGNLEVTDDSTCTMVHASLGCRNIWAKDNRGPKLLTFYLDRQDGIGGHSMRSADEGGSNVIGWTYGYGGYPAGYWARCYGNQNLKFYSYLTSTLAKEGPGWDGEPYGALLGDPNGALLFRGLDTAVSLKELRGGLRLVGDVFENASPALGSWLTRAIISQGYRGDVWEPSHAYLAADATYGTFADVVEPTATHAAWSRAGGQAWRCTTAGQSGAVEPVWPGAPVAGVTTVADGTVVWTYFGATPEWSTIDFLNVMAGGPVYEKPMLDADQVMTPEEASYPAIFLTGVLTAPRTLTFTHPASYARGGVFDIIHFGSGHPVTLRTGTGSTIAMAVGAKARISITPNGVIAVASYSVP